MKITKKKIPIEVSGHSANILRVVAGGSTGLIAIVELAPPVQGLVSFGVDIPIRQYDRDALISVAVKNAQKSIQRHIERTEKERRDREEQGRMEKLAKEITKAVGLS